jgi:phosphate transport system permease protein
MATSLSADVLGASPGRLRISGTALYAVFFSGLFVFFFFAMGLFVLAGGYPALARHGWGLVSRADWFPRGGHFGAASMIYGSAVVAGSALLSAVPLAFGAAVMTAEYLPPRLRLYVKSLIELLAGIPSVVYGLLGVLFLRPFIFQVSGRFHPESGDNLLTAGLLVGVMILPTVMTLADDAFRSVPGEDREAARALGLTREETFLHAVLPRAVPGLISAVFLGLGRALGETIAVYLVVGRADNRLPGTWFSPRPFLEAGQTLTSKLGGPEVPLGYGSPGHWSALMALACLVLALTGLCVLGAELLSAMAKRYRPS